MKKVLVTGGGGYIGSAVVDLLLEKGHAPVVYDTFLWGRDALAPFRDRIEIIEGDARNSGELAYALQGVEAVIHLAGIVGESACNVNHLAHYTANIESANTLVNLMTDPEVDMVRDLIFASSCSVYGNVKGMFEEVNEETRTMPLSTYAFGKLRAEEIIMKKAAEVAQFSPTILRLTTIFGWSNRTRLDLVTNLFVHKALTEKKITIFGDGSQYRSLIHVYDVASALVTVLDAPRFMRDRQVFHVGEESNNVSLKELAQIVKENVPEAELVFREEADTDRRDYRISCQKIKNTFGWKASRSVQDGIRELVAKLGAAPIDISDPRHRNVPHEYR